GGHRLHAAQEEHRGRPSGRAGGLAGDQGEDRDAGAAGALTRGATTRVSPIASTKKSSSPRPAAAASRASERGGSSSGSSVSSNVPQCTPSERLAATSRWILTASAALTCWLVMNQRGS